MIIELLLNVIKVVIYTVFSFINLPDFPVSLQNSINSYLDMIFDNINIFGVFSFFIRSETLKIVLVSFLTVFAFSKAYRFIRWIISHIPFVK